MNRYKVALINRHLNMRKFLDVISDTAVDAIAKAKNETKNSGFDEVESISLVEILG